MIVFSVQFFSSGLAQKGEDHEGFDGFLIKDIKKEISRAKRLVSQVKYYYQRFFFKIFHSCEQDVRSQMS